MKRSWKKTKTRTKTGSKSAFVAALALLLVVASLAPAHAKDKPKNAPAPYALIAGTVFRPPGLSLAGARVEIKPATALPGGIKLKETRFQTDTRGEFAIRVPAVPMRYSVHVQASGYQPQARSASVEGEQRVDVNFTLEPEVR